MSEESAYVPAPYNGISQAAPQVRLLEQAADLQDSIVDLPDGWRKRPPLRWLGQLFSGNANVTARAHGITDPDDGSFKFLIVNREGSATVPRLFDSTTLAGIGLTISGSAQTYLNTAILPIKTTLRISQCVDDTMLVSRDNIIGLDPTPYATRPHEALVFIKSGAFGKKYQVTVTKSGGSPIIGQVTTPDGDNPGGAFFVATDVMGQAIFHAGTYTTADGASSTDMGAALVTAGFTVTTHGAVTYLSNTTDFTVAVQDDQGGIAIVAPKGTVSNFSDLPADGVVDGFTVSVVPARGDKAGAYYVKFNANPALGQQKWQETVAPGGSKGFDPSDMPARVYKDGSGNWQCDQPAWKQRLVGDATLAIDPLFVGDTIQDVGYAFGRIVIVSQEECFLTAADDPFRIYPATLTTQIDSDPISLSPPSDDAKFRSITTWASDPFEGAFLMGLKMQAVLRNTGDGPVTPTAVKLSRMSKYEGKENFMDMRPVYNNNKVYMPVQQGTLYTGIREMKIDRVSGESLGDDLTAAQPKYLPAGLNVAATCQTTYTSMYGVAGTSKIYTHIFRYNDNQRVQNGLFTWNLPANYFLCDIVSNGTLFYFFLAHTNGTLQVFVMETASKALDDDASSTVLTNLDLRQSEGQVAARTYNATTNQTTIGTTIPMPLGTAYVAARAFAGPTMNYPEGYLAEVISQPDTNTVIVKGDWTDTQRFYVGVGYAGTWTPSTIYKVSPQDSRIMHGSLTISRVIFDLAQASGLAVQVQNGKRQVRTKSLPMSNFGLPTLYTGQFEVTVGGNNTDITMTIRDEGHIGPTISGFEWQGTFVTKVKRTT